MKASRNFMDELRIMERGGYYLTPFQDDHIYEFIHIIHPENIKELLETGLYPDVLSALKDLTRKSEVYLVRDKNDEIIFVGGLFFDEDTPQMFAMFSTKIKDNFFVLARGSKMLVNFFDKTYPMLSMVIKSDYADMLQWAAWLGFETVGCSQYKNINFIHFVRCNPDANDVVDELSRPIKH